MAEEIVYADLDIGSGRCSRKVHSLPQPGILHQQPENPESCKNGSGNAGDGNSTLEKIRSELRKELCLPNLQGFPKPYHWETQQLLLDRPLPPLSWEGLDLAERLPRGLAPVSAWGAMGVGMGAPQGPSCCDTESSCSSRFWLSSWSGGSCAVLKGNSIMSQSCSSGSHWICQKEATQL
ncbi:hypothetical protein Q9233_000488 [Columba guinea]|nr:hypothetical protein Q9233_000488 [Columba guinea]